MDKETLKDPTYQCPVCDTEDLPLSKLFLKQEKGSSPKPIACIECITGLFFSISNKENPDANISR